MSESRRHHSYLRVLWLETPSHAVTEVWHTAHLPESLRSNLTSEMQKRKLGLTLRSLQHRRALRQHFPARTSCHHPLILLFPLRRRKSRKSLQQKTAQAKSSRLIGCFFIYLLCFYFGERDASSCAAPHRAFLLSLPSTTTEEDAAWRWLCLVTRGNRLP